MLKLVKLKTSNYCQHPNLEVEFSKSATVIIGDNGFGKSNLLNACEFAITGKSNNPGKRNEDITWGQDKGSVTVWVNINDVDYKLARNLHNSKATLHRGEELLADSAANVEAVMSQLLGTNVSSVEQMFIKQGDVANAIYATPTKREQMFMELFNTDTAKFRELLQAEILQATAPDNTAGVLAELKSQMVVDILPEITAVTGAINEATTRVAPFNPIELGAIVDTYDECERAKRREIESANQIKVIRVRISENENMVSMVFKKLGAKPLESIKLVEASIIERKTRLEEASAFRLWEENHNSAVTNVATAEREIATLVLGTEVSDIITDELHSHDSKAHKLSESINKDTVQLKLYEAGKCPTCSRSFKNPAKLADALTTKLADATEKLEGFKAMRNSIAERLPPALRAQREATQREATLKQVIEQNKLWTAAAKPFRQSKATEQELIEAISELEKRLSISNNLVTENDNAEAMLVSDKELLASMSVEGAAECEITQEQYESAKAGLTFCKEITDFINVNNGTLNSLNNRREVLANRIEQAELAEAKHANLNTYRELCETARSALHRSNIPAAANRKYVEALNGLLSKHLQMFNAGFTAYITTDLEFSVIFAGISDERSALRLSGGQKVMLSIAFWFSISELFTQGLGLIVFDEPTAFLDDKNVEGIREVFDSARKYINNSGAQLIVVTHEKGIQQSFDKTITIS